MQTRAHHAHGTRPRRLLLAAVGLAGCIPPSPPPWVVGYPVTWGISTQVVAADPLAQYVLDVPGRTRSELVPGDTLEWRWHGAGPEGASLRPPIWLWWGDGLFLSLPTQGAPLPACPQPILLSTPLCRLGEGERVRMTLGEPAEAVSDVPNVSVVAVASDGDQVEPETCLQRALSERDADLRGCLIAFREVRLGPSWFLWIYPPHKFAPSIPLDRLPPEFFDVPANFNPMLTAIHVRHGAAAPGGDLVVDGDTVVVRPGEPITVTLRLDDDAAQTYVIAGQKQPDGRYPGKTMQEDVKVAVRLDAEVDDYLATDTNLEHRWTAPDFPEPLTLYIRVQDGRLSFAFATLHFVSAPAGSPAP